MQKNKERKAEAIAAIKGGLNLLITKYVNSLDEPTRKLISFSVDEEKRINAAIENATYSIVNWDVGLLSDIDNIIEEQRNATNLRRSGDLSEQIRNYVRDYQHDAEKSQIYVKSFLDDVRVWFRAFQMQLQMVGTGGTHAEKNARYRGMVAFIDGLIDKINEVNLDYFFADHRYRNIFKSEYPIRHMIEKVNYQKEVNERLVKMLKEKGVTEEEINYQNNY